MKFISIIGALAILAGGAAAQEPPNTNPAIGKILLEISADRIRSNVETLVRFGTRHALSDTVSTTRGIGAARRWIYSEFEKAAARSGGRMEVSFDEFDVPPSRRMPQSTRMANVVAMLHAASGDGHERVLVVGGHYDSRASDITDASSDAPGANDDGSGTAVVLELARVLTPYHFDATIVFIAFVGEEEGLLGATHWSEEARAKGWNVEAMLNNDIIGSSRGGTGRQEGSYVRLFSEAYSESDTGAVFRARNNLGLENDGASRTLARTIQDIASRYIHDFNIMMIYRRDRFLRGGDHSPFHDRGYAAVRFSVAEENYDWQHQNVRTVGGKDYGDLVQFMDFQYCTNVAKVNAAVLATLGFAPRPPSGTGLVVSNLEYSTTLRWNRNTERDLAGYIVRYRETTSPVWQHSLFTRDTTLILPILKDDMLFGVQSVDRDGNTSLVSIPRPVR